MILTQRGKLLILLVPGERIELSRGHAPRDFKSLASTSSATQAVKASYNEQEFVVKRNDFILHEPEGMHYPMTKASRSVKDRSLGFGYLSKAPLESLWLIPPYPCGQLMALNHN